VVQLPAVPIGEPAAPVTPVTPPSPPSSSIWLWPLLLLLLLGVIPARDRIWKPLVKRTQAPKRAVMPPLFPRLTFIPRLDPGQQVLTTQHRGPAGGIDVVYHVTAGTQHIRSDAGVGRVADMGA
jgi:hypothetical protein